MKPKYLKEWLSLPEAIELVDGDAVGLELAVREGKVTPQLADSRGRPTYLQAGQMASTVRLDVARNLVVIQDTDAPWAKDIEHTAPNFSRSQIISAFGLEPKPLQEAPAQSTPKKRRLGAAGGRPRKQDWYPIDIFIAAYAHEHGIPQTPEQLLELKNELQAHTDEEYMDPPGREDLNGRVKTVLADLTEMVFRVKKGKDAT